MKIISIASCAIGLNLAAAVASGESVEIGAGRDNTLYEDTTGSLSNGEGEWFFTGTTATDDIRRGVIAFDVAGDIPAGATITDVTLQLYMSRTISGSHPADLHRLLADWGEGGSNASGQEGGGASAQAGDATWIHRFYDSEFWDEPGGDFEAEPSASTAVAGLGSYTWSSAGMVADVQDWLDNPETNFGWLLKGNEATSGTAKRFDSRTSANASRRPVLVVEYSIPADSPPPAFTAMEWVEEGLSLTFRTTPDHLHTVEWTTALGAETWQTLTDGIPGDGEMVTVTDPAAGEDPRRFYRVRLEP